MGIMAHKTTAGGKAEFQRGVERGGRERGGGGKGTRKGERESHTEREIPGRQ